MSSPATSPKASPKKVKKASKPKVAASHPPYGQMIKAAIAALKEKKGSSRAAILKYILQHYKVDSSVIKVNARLRLALKSGVKSGLLQQTKGTGASGSFRLAEKAAKAPKKTKKPAAKKSPKKAAAKKSPKKAAKKPAAKKPKSPKKAAKPKKKASPKKKAAKPKVAKAKKVKA